MKFNLSSVLVSTLALCLLTSCGGLSDYEYEIGYDTYYPHHHIAISQDSSRLALLTNIEEAGRDVFEQDSALVIMDMQGNVQGEHLKGEVYPIATIRWGKERDTIYVATHDEDTETKLFFVYNISTKEKTDLTERALELGLLDDFGDLVDDFDISPTTGNILVNNLITVDFDESYNLQIYTPKLEELEASRAVERLSPFTSTLRFNTSGTRILFAMVADEAEEDKKSRLQQASEVYYVIDSELAQPPRRIWGVTRGTFLSLGADWIDADTVLVPDKSFAGDPKLVGVDVTTGEVGDEYPRYEDSNDLDVSPDGKWLVYEESGFRIAEL